MKNTVENWKHLQMKVAGLDVYNKSTRFLCDMMIAIVHESFEKGNSLHLESLLQASTSWLKRRGKSLFNFPII